MICRRLTMTNSFLNKKSHEKKKSSKEDKKRHKKKRGKSESHDEKDDKHNKKEKSKKKRKSKDNMKEKDKSKVKDKHTEKQKRSTLSINQNEYGKYGIIREEHFFQKQRQQHLIDSTVLSITHSSIDCCCFREFEAYMEEVHDIPGVMMLSKREVSSD